MGQEILIKGSLARFASGKPALEDFKVGSPVEGAVMQLELQADFRIRYVAAQWLLAAQKLRLQNPSLGAGNPQALFERAWALGWGSYLNAMGTTERELSGAERATQYRGFDTQKGGNATNPEVRIMRQQRGSELLSIRDLDPEFIIKMRNLNLEIAMGMEDWNKATQALTAMEGDLGLPGVDLQAVFFASAHTGRISSMAKVAKGMSEASLKTFHTRSLANPNEVDYSVLIKLADQPLPTVGQIPSYLSFAVDNYRVRLINAEGTNAGRIEAAKNTLGSWQSRDASAFADHPFLRIGAVAHWLRPGQTNLPMTGVWGENSMVLMGYADLENGESRRETWALKASGTSGLWTGTLTQETISKSGEKLVLTLETELKLK